MSTEERYSLRSGINFQIQRPPRMLKAKSDWDELRIS